MPPHCDSLDGPVVTAARDALAQNNVDLVLAFVHAPGEQEVREAFERTMRARTLGDDAQEVADRYFFENVVRVHRAGEGASYTGLKPAGLSEGPVIPLAEKAVVSGSVDEVHGFLADQLHQQLTHRLDNVRLLAGTADDSLTASRAHVEAMLDFEVFSHHTYLAMTAGAGPHAVTASGPS